MKVKNILIPVLAIATLITSCAPTQEDLISEVVQNNMKDPSSYELVKVELTDTFTVSDHFTELIDYCNQKVNDELQLANEELKYSKLFVSTSMIQKYLDNAKVHSKMANSWLEKRNGFRDELSSVQNTPQDTIRELRYKVTCYGNNSFGARVLNNVDVKVLPNGEIKL